MTAINLLKGNPGATPKRTLLIVADGYKTDAEKAAFSTAAQSVAAAFNDPLRFPQVGEFQIYSADTWIKSTHRTDLGFDGACGPGVQPVPKTRFGSRYGPDSQGSCHYLTGDPGKVTDLLDDLYSEHPSLPAVDYVIVLVNFAQYGGMAQGKCAWISANDPQRTSLALHEAGHMFGLHDEYENGCGIADEALTEEEAAEEIRDMNISNDSVNPLWRIGGEALTVYGKASCTDCATTGVANSKGTFQGASYTHCRFYRPYRDCLMRDLAKPYCDVCWGVIAYALDSKHQMPVLN